MKIFAKKVLGAVLCVILIFLLCACEGSPQSGGKNTQTSGAMEENNTKTNNGSTQPDNNMPQNITENTSHTSGTLCFLCGSESCCNTENGYYYLTGETTKLRGDDYGTHLMYMDFATCQEIYLCSTAGCRHDTADCPAVFLYDEFPSYTTKLFIFKNNLYILSREYDNDGSMSQDMLLGESGLLSPEKSPAVLYRAGLDGTGRKPVYTFDSDLTLEDHVIGDENGIYIITKKLSVDKIDNASYTTLSERRLMFLDLESFDIKEICSMDFNDGISWQVIGCCENSLILSGIDFGKELSLDEKWDDDIHKELYEKSFDVYAVLDLESGALREFYRISNKEEHSARVVGDILYLSSSENQDIEGLNILTGEKKTICTLSQNFIMDTLGDMLCCRDWNLSKDSTWYFVNTKTGEISHSSLVNQCNGWELEFYAELASDVLVVYDYDAEKNSDGSYSIYQKKCALISKEDLFAGKENYRKIKMIGPGE